MPGSLWRLGRILEIPTGFNYRENGNTATQEDFFPPIAIIFAGLAPKRNSVCSYVGLTASVNYQMLSQSSADSDEAGVD